MSEGVYRAEYVQALALLAKASTMVRSGGGPVPVLVGGAVVEFDTASQIVSGDFDFVSADEKPFVEALVELGFERSDGLASRTGALLHPMLGIGVEFVSGAYFDGKADKGRIRLVRIDGAEISMAPTEDLIADRLGQWIASDRKDQDVLYQAVALFRLAEEPDLSYLDKRVRDDTCGELYLESFSELCDEIIDLG